MEDGKGKLKVGDLRRALRILDYTNESLANELTDIRTDNAATSVATVSRWISGASNPDPGVLLFLRERLRQKARLITPKLSRCIVIGINGFKGGCGNSLMSNLLAVWAGSLGLRVAHVIADEGCNNYFHQEFPLCNGINLIKGEEGLSSIPLEKLDLVFIDLPRDAFSGYSRQFFSLESLLVDEMDVLISPTNIGSFMHLNPLCHAYESMEQRGLAFTKRIVAFSNCINLISVSAGLNSIEPWQEFLHPFSIHPPTVSDLLLKECSIGGYRIADPDLAWAFGELMGELIENITGDSLEIYLNGENKTDHMEIPDLVALIESV